MKNRRQYVLVEAELRPELIGARLDGATPTASWR